MGNSKKTPDGRKKNGDRAVERVVLLTILTVLIFLIAQTMSFSKTVQAENLLNQDNIQDTADSAISDTEVDINGLMYRLDGSTHKAVLIGNISLEGVITIPEEINYGGATYSVTEIADDAFSANNADNQKITGFVFESKKSLLETIGASAFYGRKNFTGALDLPHSVKTIGLEAYRNTGFTSLTHKKVAGLQEGISFPSLAGVRPELRDERELREEGYESIVDSSEGNISLRKSAKWTDENLTEAEILIEYGENEQIASNLDFIFVMDYSSSMLTPAAATGISDQQQYSYPRSFYMEDLVRDTAKAILGDGAGQSSNRVGLVAFGGVNGAAHDIDSLLWTTGFTQNLQDIDTALTGHPLIDDNVTDYTAGMKGAVRLIEERDQQADVEYKNRKTVIFFLSDGMPLPESANGIDEANQLKGMGVEILPIAMYTAQNSYLQALSSNGAVYDAGDTAKFEEAVEQALLEAVENAVIANTEVVDVLSEHFVFQSGTDADAIVSPGGGSASVSSSQAVWDLSGISTGTVHTLTLKIRLTDGTEMEKAGALPTNKSMETAGNGIITKSQPELERYLINYQFVSETDPEAQLPEAVMAQLPQTEGGFRDTAKVYPQAIAEKQVTAENGEVWVFSGWDQDEVTINKGNVLYTGKWARPQLSFEFIKVDGSGGGAPLGGAGFTLYECRLKNDPGHTHAELVTGNAQDCWQEKRTEVSAADTGQVRFDGLDIGQYMLVETKTKEGYTLPHGQWLIIAKADGAFEIEGKGTSLPPAFALTADEQGHTVYRLPNYKTGDVPLTGGFGAILFTAGGVIMIGLAAAQLVMARKK